MINKIIIIAILLCSLVCTTNAQENDTILLSNIKFELDTDFILPNDFGYQHLTNTIIPYLRNHSEDIDSIYITGTASPDGTFKRNTILANIRCNRILKEFSKFDQSRIVTSTIPEDYNTLNLLIKDERINNNRVFKLYYPSVRAVYVRIKMKTRESQPLISNTTNTSIILKTDTIIKTDTIFITKNCQLKPILGIKTNVLLDLIPYSPFGISFTPNIQAELYTHFQGLSVEFEYTFPWFSNTKKHKFYQILNGTLGIRKYFKKTYYGWYIGIYGNTGYYDLGINETTGWQGEHYGFGLSAGYVFKLSKNFKLEPYIRAGYLHTVYDDYHAGRPFKNKYYYNWTGKPSDFKERQKSANWYGPTMIGVNITLDFYIGK